MFGLQSAYFPELFGARRALQRGFVRVPGLGGIGGGFSPRSSPRRSPAHGWHAGVSMMLILLALLTLVATFFAHETKDQPLLK